MTTNPKDDNTLGHIGRYEIRRILGKGSMGAVYAAWDPLLRREVAIKQVISRVQAQAKGATRFEREAQAIAAIRQPNVVQIFDYGMADDASMYLVMEKLEGADLFELMQRQGALPEVVAVAVGHELCLALEAAHSAGILHRDLKPENVFLTGTGRVVLTDFGIVKAFGEQAAIEGYREKTEVIGTPGFMAPEHMRGRGLGPSIDLFALGALMYNIATLNMPYAGSSARAVYEAAAYGEVQDPRKFVPQLSPEFIAVLGHCLTRDPRRRPHSAATLRLALQGVLEDLGVLDLRQDLQDYVSDPTSLGLRASKREAASVVAALKVAKVDGDTQGQTRLLKRLKLIAPQDPALLIMEQDAPQVAKNPLAQLLRTNAQMLLSSQLHQVPSGAEGTFHVFERVSQVMVAIVLLVLCGYALGHHASATVDFKSRQQLSHLTLPPPNRLVTAAVLAASEPESPVTDLDVEVVTGAQEPITVTVDGYEVEGSASHKQVVNPGRHLLEVRGGEVHFRRHIMVAAGEHLRLVADCAHRMLMVR